MRCYSTNGENFDYVDLDSAVDSAQEEGAETVTVWGADAVVPDITDFIPNIVEEMHDSAFGEHGEYADDFMDIDKEAAAELQDAVNKVIIGFATANNLLPNFYGVVENAERIVVKITDELSGDYEIIEGNE